MVRDAGLRPANHEPPEVHALAAVVGGLFPDCLFPVRDTQQNGPDGVVKTPPELSPQSVMEIEAMTNGETCYPEAQKSTEKGEALAKIIAALTKHYK
ncbi:hypothetical protein Pan258_12910 [Symmachiella dynata]|uniref:hypothetical protein n=1 Tax=Symmachiella dynata TaxID=2527995 RepID=UPI0011893543|nr:hypothetical protein [Symmachiella dynata]QDT47260.1 hypothetical protein Pan258_12910 [Symmachiella dynata]